MEIIKDLEFLRKKSKKVEKIDDEIRELVLIMAKTMKEKKGIGLAACQIGHLKRIIVINKEDGFDTFINPVILKKSKDSSKMEEGCLSLPECLVEVKRLNKIKIKFLKLEGNENVSNLENIEARVFQHEYDHLNGTLITDKNSLFQKIKNCLIK